MSGFVILVILLVVLALLCAPQLRAALGGDNDDTSSWFSRKRQEVKKMRDKQLEQWQASKGSRDLYKEKLKRKSEGVVMHVKNKYYVEKHILKIHTFIKRVERKFTEMGKQHPTTPKGIELLKKGITEFRNSPDGFTLSAMAELANEIAKNEDLPLPFEESD